MLCYNFVDEYRLDSSGEFNPEHLGYITFIFEDIYDSRFLLCMIRKYKEVTDFIKKLWLCDLDFIQSEELVAYGSLVQDFTHEYCNFSDLKWWETSARKEKSQDHNFLPNTYNVEIDQSINKYLNHFGFKSRNSEIDSDPVEGSSDRSGFIFH